MDELNQVAASSPRDGEAAFVDIASEPYVGRWNRLVSTTNWEKGRIITEWRDSLLAAGAPSAEYSDEAWSRLVGGVTGQHVGRLRRVFQRFGHVYGEYTDLCWSHFQAALDWSDAEMWLEGAVQNQWSVSQMRCMRWETLGAVAEQEPGDAEIVAAELDEDFVAPPSDAPPESLAFVDQAEATQPVSLVGSEAGDITEQDAAGNDDREAGAGQRAAAEQPETVALVRPFANLADLPDDLAEAFESFKLAILRHKTDDWRQVSQHDVLASLDALKALVTAPSADTLPR